MDSVHEILNKRKGIHKMDTFSCWERLREKGRSGTVVLVSVVAPVGVELDLVAVEVEDRRVREVTIGVWIIAFIHPLSPSLELYFSLETELCALSPEFNLAVFTLRRNLH